MKRSKNITLMLTSAALLSACNRTPENTSSNSNSPTPTPTPTPHINSGLVVNRVFIVGQAEPLTEEQIARRHMLEKELIQAEQNEHQAIQAEEDANSSSFSSEESDSGRGGFGESAGEGGHGSGE